MTRSAFNRLCWVLPALFSAMAAALVVFNLVTGWETQLRDEGISAHIYQRLILAQAPLLFACMVSADRRAPTRMARDAAWPVAGLAVALGLVLDARR